MAIIETGNTCNINCATCPTPRRYLGSPLSLMNSDNLKKIIDNIKNHVHVVLLYNTNEPLLNPYLGKMIKYASKQHLYTMVSTNATLLDEKKTDELLVVGLDEILLCLDGTSKESYEPFRVGADFDTVLKNIKYFCIEKQRKHLIKPYVEIQFIVTKLNQDQIPEMKKLAKELKTDRLRIKSLAVVEYAYTEQERKDLMEKFFPTRDDVKVRYEKNHFGAINKRVVNKCDTVKNQISILVDGRMVLCCYDVRGEYEYGNLLEKSFVDIWFDPQNIEKRRIAEGRKHALCAKCDLY